MYLLASFYLKATWLLTGYGGCASDRQLIEKIEEDKLSRSKTSNSQKGWVTETIAYGPEKKTPQAVAFY